MSALKVVVEVSGSVRLTDAQAEVVAHLCSFDLVKEFAKAFSHKYTDVQILDTLKSVKAAAELIVKARDAAISAAIR